MSQAPQGSQRVVVKPLGVFDQSCSLRQGRVLAFPPDVAAQVASRFPHCLGKRPTPSRKDDTLRLAIDERLCDLTPRV